MGPLEQETSGYVTKKFWAGIKQDANLDAYRLVSELNDSMTLNGKKDPSEF
jgi:hypothetical protein